MWKQGEIQLFFKKTGNLLINSLRDCSETGKFQESQRNFWKSACRKRAENKKSFWRSQTESIRASNKQRAGYS